MVPLKEVEMLSLPPDSDRDLRIQQAFRKVLEEKTLLLNNPPQFTEAPIYPEEPLPYIDADWDVLPDRSRKNTRGRNGAIQFFIGLTMLATIIAAFLLLPHVKATTGPSQDEINAICQAAPVLSETQSKAMINSYVANFLKKEGVYYDVGTYKANPYLNIIRAIPSDAYQNAPCQRIIYAKIREKQGFIGRMFDIEYYQAQWTITGVENWNWNCTGGCVNGF